MVQSKWKYYMQNFSIYPSIYNSSFFSFNVLFLKIKFEILFTRRYLIKFNFNCIEINN